MLVTSLSVRREPHQELGEILGLERYFPARGLLVDLSPELFCAHASTATKGQDVHAAGLLEGLDVLNNQVW